MVVVAVAARARLMVLQSVINVEGPRARLALIRVL
jgi:hypothetical protein